MSGAAGGGGCGAVTPRVPRDEAIRAAITGELEDLEVPAFAWDAVRRRAARPHAERTTRGRVWVGPVVAACVLGLAAVAAAANTAWVQAVLGRHARLLGAASGGGVRAINRRGFVYVVSPPRPAPGGGHATTVVGEPRVVTLGQAELDARTWGHFAVVPPSGLPAEARPVKILETPPLGGLAVMFTYRMPGGQTFLIAERRVTPAGGVACPRACLDLPHWREGGTEVTIALSRPDVLTLAQEDHIHTAMRTSASAGVR